MKARYSDTQVLQWSDRNGFPGNLAAARTAMEDAASLTPEAEPSAYETDLAHFRDLARKPRNAGWTSLKRRADAQGVPVEGYRYHNEGDRLQLALELANKIHGRA